MIAYHNEYQVNKVVRYMLTKEARTQIFLKQKCCKSKLMFNKINIRYSWLCVRRNSAVVLCFHNTYAVYYLRSSHVVLFSEVWKI